MDAAAFLGRLRDRLPIEAPAAIVVAHPDDETIGAGASLALFSQLTLVHVTDGAPRDLRDAHAAGFETVEEYAATRRCELREAMRAARAAPRLLTLNYPDREACLHVPEIERRLAAILSGIALAITHACEHGHPDHDACALAVRRACAALPDRPALLEFPAYHAAADGRRTVQQFPAGEPSGIVLTLDAPAVARKRAALACFVTQRSTLAQFDPARELFRIAPECGTAASPQDGGVQHGEGTCGRPPR